MAEEHARLPNATGKTYTKTPPIRNKNKSGIYHLTAINSETRKLFTPYATSLSCLSSDILCLTGSRCLAQDNKKETQQPSQFRDELDDTCQWNKTGYQERSNYASDISDMISHLVHSRQQQHVSKRMINKFIYKV